MSAPLLLTSAKDMAELAQNWRGAGHTIALVPTMGSLHEGHLALVARAGEVSDRVVVSVFVNPLQFGAAEDFEQYPRSIEADLAALGSVKVDAVFVPQVTEVYPDWPETTPTHSAGAVGNTYEGADRPGHFDGVLTVVARLFDLVCCDEAVFGQKDAQQVFVVTQMANSRTPPVGIHVVETVREDGGVARSSRNSYLSPEAMSRAGAISRAGSEIIRRLSDSPRGSKSLPWVTEVIARARESLVGSGFDCHYVDLVDAATFLPWRGADTNRVVGIIACSIDGVRLLDSFVWTSARVPED